MHAVPPARAFLTQTLHDVTAPEDGVALFVCCVWPPDTPPPVWLAAGRPLTSGDKYRVNVGQGGRHSLRIERVTMADSGVVSVVLASQIATARLIVEGNKQILSLVWSLF